MNVTTKLGLIVTNHDRARSPIKGSDRVSGPYPYYGASGIIDRVEGYTHDGEYLLLAEDGENLRSRYTPVAFLASGKFWANNHVHVVRAPEVWENRFLCYMLNRTDLTRYLSGSTMPKLTQAAMNQINLELPPRAMRRAITEVLGSLDDKIVANTAAARAANDLATAHFDLAARSGSRSDQTYGEISAVGGGGTPKTGVQEYWGGSVSWATPTDVTALSAPYLEATARTITEKGLTTCSSPLYPAGSILMTSRATIGAFAINSKSTAVNQGFIVVNPHNDELRWWLFHEMRSRVPEYLSHANGATFLELSRGKFKALPVWLADRAAMARFSKTAEGLHASARQAHVENGALNTLRETLLPHLMSGRLRVKDAERQVEAVV